MNKLRKNIRDISFMSKKNGKVIVIHNVIARQVARLLEIDDRVERYDTDVQLETLAERVGPMGIRDTYLETEWKTDFVIFLVDSRAVVIEVETRDNLEKKSVIEKLEISRRYWKGNADDWKIVMGDELLKW